MPIDAARKDYSAMLPKWQRLRDCFKGRDAVLLAGKKYVPELPGADLLENQAYRERGNFYNAVKRTVGGMNGAIFQSPPEVEMPETFKTMLDDITLTNVAFESFTTEVGSEIFLKGRHGVLVDMPVVPEGQTANVDIRPYCVAYLAEDIINWRTERQGGDNVLTMVVLREEVEDEHDSDPFCSDVTLQYRALLLKDKKCVVQIWKEDKNNKGAYVMDKETTLMRRGEPLTFVPFVFFGALSSTPDLEQPPLIDLADINLGHWRNSVDYEYGLHLVALPTPWVAGKTGNQDGQSTKIGPSVVWELELQGSAGMLEFTGEGLKSLVAAMDEKKKQMASQGARLLEDAPTVGETAAAVKLRHSGETASLRTVAQSLEQGFTLVLQIACWWQSLDARPSDVAVTVELNKEYMNVRATPQEIQAALTALQAGEISFETWYNILQTGGWAREGIDAAAEKDEIARGKALKPEPPIDPNLSPNE